MASQGISMFNGWLAARRMLVRTLAIVAAAFVSTGHAQSADTLTLTQQKLGNIFLTTETVEIPVTTTADSVAWTVTDFGGAVTYGTVVGLGSRGGGGGPSVTIRPGTGRKGYFELHLDAKRDGSIVASADTTFAVLAPVDVSTMADSPFGVMTHFAQTWDTDLMPLIACAGLRQIRDEQYWDTVETAPGTYQFNDSYTGYMAAAKASHLDPLMELTFGNVLHDHDPDNPTVAWAPVTDEGRAGYANYAQALLDRYGTQIGNLEVWNEYNGGWCAGPAAANKPLYYTQMLKTVYQTVKAQRPDVQVLGGAAVLAPQPWFEDLFAAGALDYMDAAVIHPYYNLPEDVEKPVLAIQDSMRRYNHGAGAKPIWATETSIVDPAHPGRQDMARNLVRLLTLMRAVGVERVYWYLMRDYNEFTTGLLRSDRDPLGRYVPTAAYPAYANLIQQLYHAQYVRRETTDLRTRFYLFNKDGAELRVLWSTEPPSHLQLRTTQPLTVIDIMGEPQTLQPQNGVVSLTVDKDPLYVLGHVDSVREVGRDVLLADSVDGFSGVQGTAPGTWSYGYYKVTADPYRPDQFQTMSWTRTSFDYSWQCPYAYAILSNTVAGPSYAGDAPVWTVRRWQSSAAGTARITGAANHASAGGDGTGIKIFVDGKEVFSSLVGAPGGTTQATFDLSVPLEAGSLVDFVATPGPGVDINFDAVDYRAQITLPAVAVPTSFQDWQQQYFSAGQLADPAVSGPTADPLGDGVCNLLKYAFGLDPSINASGQQPRTEVRTVDSLPYLTLSFRRLLASTDVSYIVEVADSVAGNAWTPGGVAVGDPVDDEDNATETVTYRDDVSLTEAPQRFMRLRVVH